MVKLIYTAQKKELIIDGKSIELFEYIGNIKVEEEAFKYLTYLENQKVNGLKLEDMYLYDNIPLYIFNRPTIYRKLNGLVFCTIIIKKTQDKINEELTVKTDDDFMEKVCVEIFNLQCEKVYTEKNIEAVSKSKLFRRFTRGIKNYCRFIFKHVILKKKNDKSTFLVISHALDLNLVKGNSMGYCDTQLGMVIEELKVNYNILNFQLLNNKYVIDKTLNCNEDFVPFELLIFYKRLKARKFVDNNLLVDNLSYLDKLDFHFHELDLKSIFLDFVMKDLRKSYISYLHEFLVAEKLINKFKIKKCLVAGEGDRGRCFIAAGNKLNVDTYAIQHGIINETSSPYIINSNYKAVLVAKSTFVWGEKYKELLIGHTNVYKKENINVVGQVRTDHLVQNGYLKSSKRRGSLKIFYATQHFRDLLEPATLMLFKALSLMKEDYELIIKLHPGDLCFEFYEDMVEKFHIKNCKIMKDGDLYELIKWSDLIISVHSTVVVEAALMNKPSICILLPKYNDAGGFVKDGLSFGVKDENELLAYMVKINLEHITLNLNIQNYIHENFYMLDGKVTKRIVDIIEN
ncbi:CDP-glycerol glycerophosphotransferase family protein [Clostridium estertheticum]|uniref:CDP-glycerol glycerophosphotransferase family protein n=1 Tax=Clostridium estertheticum TaxID=238834 RepID=UPI001C7D81FB|nr:CDP-glycerol glycerophosphotransferase family protein [Clostridium estertheticum]MBX4265968.1 CDP-glycerol glycerophosphotransferase family protein [Clostridium estertheticum]MBX4268705.1 CDP-glycerol glycerophosphotransferase family protein [Clostridium estertheticum]WLC79094.1 CDP-glycerol glycerophosphotransferase family protein [Clostridium estertheticum]WLC90113.1 CDP-glycerol glycerophosphotransferase family protein [Clostridium estertheticum]